MKKKLNKILISLMIVLLMLPIVSSERVSAFSPHDVESSVRNNWNKIYGTKNNNMRSGRNIVYDVYFNKYKDSGYAGGYRIVNRNFGNGNQPYLNFRGWAVNFGYKRHTSTNHDTYIVAKKVGSTTTRIYKTNKLNLSATEDLEYNNQIPWRSSCIILYSR